MRHAQPCPVAVALAVELEQGQVNTMLVVSTLLPQWEAVAVVVLVPRCQLRWEERWTLSCSTAHGR